LKKEYLKVLPALSLEDIEPRTVESDEFKELKNNYEKRFKDKDNEIADMEKKIENMGTLMEELARELQKQKN
jgi:Skp family chaperone for outer membrane proteins